MFLWTGALDRSAYIKRAAIAAACMIATIPALAIMFGTLNKQHCAEAWCGNVLMWWPFVTAVPIAMILSVCIRRARDVGLPPSLGACPAIMMLGKQYFFLIVALGKFDQLRFNSIELPVFVGFGLILMALLAVPESGALRNAGRTVIDVVLMALLGWIAVGAIQRGLFSITVLLISTVPKTMGSWLEAPFNYAPYAMLPFLALAAYRLWWSPPPMTPAAPRSPNLWRLKRSALIGASVAVVALLWLNLPTNNLFGALYALPLLLGGFLLVALVPTFAVYTLLAASIFRFRARRDAIGIIALVLASMPFALWGLSLGSVLYDKAKEHADVAALSKTALPAKPGGIVIEADDSGLENCALERVLTARRDVGDVLTHFHGSRRYSRFTLATMHSGQDVDAAPPEHILIQLPRRPEFLQKRAQIADPAVPSVEIYTVDSSGPRLAAASYTARNPPPRFPPLMTIDGWYDLRHVSNDAACRHVTTFLDRELLDKLPRERT